MAPRKRKADDDPYAEWATAAAGSSSYAYSGAYTPVAGSSSNPITVDSPPQKSTAKRQRKAKDPNAPVPEKRGAIFKKSCPQNIIERVRRVMEQR
ncbi:hypothetical protein ACG7TL_003003 [Trametes sanguinea]